MNKLEVKVYCRKCKNKTNHEIVREIKTESDSEDFYWEDTYYIVQCRGCDTLGFVRKYTDEDYKQFEEEGGYTLYYDYTVYPEEPKSKEVFIDHEVKDFYHLPKMIRQLYKQVIDAFNLNLHYLCSVGLRAIIEAICKDKGFDCELLNNADGTPKIDPNTGKQKERFLKLEEKINKLLENKHIVETQANILHQIREMGNASAHDMLTPSGYILKEAIQVIEHTLENIYEMGKKEIFKRR